MKSLILILLPVFASACDLCSVYNSPSPRDRPTTGFLLTLSQQYVPFNTLQNQGEEVSRLPFFEDAYLDNYISHLVPGYNFTPQLGVSVNVPLIHRDFRRTQATPLGQLIDEKGTETGLGDVSLIGRWTAFERRKKDRDVVVNLLAGVKIPTGDTDRLEAERDEEKRYLQLFGPRHAHAVGGVHQHDLTLGSGSLDGIFGLTANTRWKRLFFNAQFQYYLRTKAIDYEFGDLHIISGGPGVYLWRDEKCILSVQANAFYEDQDSDRAFEQINEQTGMRSWYIGPLVGFSWGKHFSANGGVDIPLDIDNRGIMSVPEYRVHGGVSWRF